MATKKKDPNKPNESKPFTREEGIRILAEAGIPMASRDDPIYNSPPSITFVNRRGPSIRKPSPGSASKPTSDPSPRSNNSTALSKAVDNLLSMMEEQQAAKEQRLAQVLSTVTLPEQQDDSNEAENPSVQEQIEAMTPGQRRRLSGGSDF